MYYDDTENEFDILILLNCETTLFCEEMYRVDEHEIGLRTDSMSSKLSPRAVKYIRECGLFGEILLQSIP